jgi:CRISPR-associated protein Cmr6
VAPRPGRGGGGSDRRREPEWGHFGLPLPRATAQKIEGAGRRPADGANLGLWLDKLVWREKGTFDLKAAHRAFALNQLCRRYRSEAGAAAVQRLVESVRALHGSGAVHVFRASLDGRLLVGYGRANAVETSLTFHSIWGTPVIPGSALKGVTRARAELHGEIDEAELLRIFGDMGRSGDLVFYDALPEDGRFEIGLDVLTPHMREYYEGREPPADWLSPSPHTFVTIVKTTFLFAVGLRAPSDSARLKRGVALLKAALKEDGVGAKTVAGYGRFHHFEDA